MFRTAFHVCIAATTLLVVSPVGAASIDLQNLQTIAGPSGQQVTQVAINDNGDIVGSSFNTSFVHSGFLIPSGGSLSLIQNPSAANTYVNGINNQRTLVGFYLTASFVQQGFSYSGGTYTPVNAGPYTYVTSINNSGDMTGYWSVPGDTATGFVIHNAVTTSFFVPGYQLETFPTGINDQGQIVGYLGLTSSPLGFLRQSDGSLQSLDFGAAGINNADIIVGMGAGGNHNIIGIVRIGSVDYSFTYPGALDTYLYGINNQGEVIGTYLNSAGGFHIFEGQIGPSAATPEPSSGALCIVFGALLALTRLQRR